MDRTSHRKVNVAIIYTKKKELEEVEQNYLEYICSKFCSQANRLRRCSRISLLLKSSPKREY